MKTCKRCGNSYPESQFYKRKTGLRAECKKCFAESRRTYYQNNKEMIQERHNKYLQEHREQISAYKSEWQRNNSEKRRIRLNERYKQDIRFRVAVNLRTRILRAIRNNQKVGSTLNILGCSIEFFIAYLESKFTENMSWDNYGSLWHIDHILPCVSFDLSKEDEQRKCFHYTNMQPLLAKDNLIKGTKIL